MAFDYGSRANQISRGEIGVGAMPRLAGIFRGVYGLVTDVAANFPLFHARRHFFSQTASVHPVLKLMESFIQSSNRPRYAYGLVNNVQKIVVSGGWTCLFK